jgi:uncharacterized protein (TIGR03000 family)
MSRTLLAAAGMIALVLPAGIAPAQTSDKTVTLEVFVADNARLFIEGKETRSSGPVRRFVSPPLPPGKYSYTLKAVMPGPKGPRVITRKVDIRPGDFESIDLRVHGGKETVLDVEYEPTPQKVVEGMLRLAKVTRNDVLWDLGCGDGRIPVTAAKKYGCKARGFDIDPERIKESLDNVKKNGVGNLVTIEKKDIFTLDLSKEPTVVALYLLPHLNERLLPQLRRLPKGARIVSNSHRMADIKPDEQMTVDTGDDEFIIYLWKVETLQRAAEKSEK